MRGVRLAAPPRRRTVPVARSAALPADHSCWDTLMAAAALTPPQDAVPADAIATARALEIVAGGRAGQNRSRRALDQQLRRWVTGRLIGVWHSGTGRGHRLYSESEIR